MSKRYDRVMIHRDIKAVQKLFTFDENGDFIPHKLNSVQQNYLYTS